MTGWLEGQPVFFVATAPVDRDGHVNCSPKGNRGEFAVLGPRTVAYLDQTGSGIETVAHVQENGRIVLMFCAFDGPPRIVRLHGTGRALTGNDPEFGQVGTKFARLAGPGVRSIVVVEVDRISDSCGYGVPLMEFRAHRPTMDEWAERKGRDGILDYWEEKNSRSIDGIEGLPLTAGIVEPE